MQKFHIARYEVEDEKQENMEQAQASEDFFGTSDVSWRDHDSSKFANEKEEAWNSEWKNVPIQRPDNAPKKRNAKDWEE
jgi:hypothetical protein